MNVQHVLERIAESRDREYLTSLRDTWQADWLNALDLARSNVSAVADDDLADDDQTRSAFAYSQDQLSDDQPDWSRVNRYYHGDVNAWQSDLPEVDRYAADTEADWIEIDPSTWVEDEVVELSELADTVHDQMRVTRRCLTAVENRLGLLEAWELWGSDFPTPEAFERAIRDGHPNVCHLHHVLIPEQAVAPRFGFRRPRGGLLQDAQPPAAERYATHRVVKTVTFLDDQDQWMTERIRVTRPGRPEPRIRAEVQAAAPRPELPAEQRERIRRTLRAPVARETRAQRERLNATLDADLAKLA